MMKEVGGALALATLLAVSAVSADEQPVADAVITAKVKAALAKDSETSSTNISVTTEDGVVVLSGNAASKAEAKQAEQNAKAVDGVKEVRNKIEVDESAS